MEVIKFEDPIDSKRLWQFQDGEWPNDMVSSPRNTWLIFGVYYLDTLESNSLPKVEQFLNQLENEIRVWNESYPWSEFNGINLQLEKTNQGQPFILGRICVEDDVVQEESIVVALLQRFTLNCGTPQLFVKVSDMDGDFLLAEASDCIPEDYQYPVSINRLWIHEGRFKMIPKEYFAYRGLQPAESLDFLKENYYKLIVIDGIQDKLSKKITSKYPRKFLNMLQRLELTIEDTRTLDILSANPKLISFALKNLLSEEIEFSQEVGELTNRSHSKEFLAPKRFIDILSIFLDSKGLKGESNNISLYCGRAVTAVINSLLQRSVIKVGSKAANFSAAHNNNCFDSHEFQVASVQEPFNIDEEQDSLQELLEGLTSLVTQDRDMKTTDDLIVDNDSDYSADHDEDIKQFFRDENVDIDEDDFFEFFLKNALKMNKESIETLQS